jgi:hypothetical protein
MRRIFVLGILLLAGCQNLIGPLQRGPVGKVDDPRLTISEQEREARDRLGMPADNRGVGPPSAGAFYPGGLTEDSIRTGRP